MKPLIIQQYFGLGDIIWGQTIANDFINEGRNVIWPALPSLVEGLNRAYPKISFIDYNILKVDYENKEFKEIGDYLFLPMRYSEHLMYKPYRFHMESKYSFLGKDWRRWKECAMPERDYFKEKKLMYQVLGLKENEPFNLVATTFGSTGQHQAAFRVKNNFRNIQMDVIDGYSLFDWCMVMEKATTVHAVSSSSLYLFEILSMQAEEIHLYPRLPIEHDFRYVEFLFSKPYILHQ